MKKIIRLTESDLARIVRRVIKEETEMTKMFEQEKGWLQEQMDGS
jgi:phage FluMu protein gp41